LSPKTQTLSERERRFVSAYVGKAAGNATVAAKLAGYSAKSARRIGTRLSSKVHVRSAIGAAQEKLTEQAGVSVARVVQELARIGFADIRQLFDETNALKPIQDLSDDAAAIVVGLDVRREKTTIKTLADGTEQTVEDSVIKVKSADKIGALSLLARHLGMLHDKVDHKHSFTLEEALEASRADGAAA
jgi:phage terminase small subunit